MPYGNLLADVVQGSTANTPPVFKDGNGTTIGTLCRAWVNFNGTGTVAIRASFNVSSITDNGTGNYIVNFTNAMPDADYAVALNGAPQSLGGYYRVGEPMTTTSANVRSHVRSDGSLQDSPAVYVAIFR
jgi:hypothetical protein